MKWYLSAIFIIATMFYPAYLNAGGGVVVAPTEPIVIPDTPDECGCPQN